jgi:hypothetical protein
VDKVEGNETGGTMSFKDLGEKNAAPHVDTPEEAELRARAAARHRAKEERAAKRHEHRAVDKEPDAGGPGRREPAE